MLINLEQWKAFRFKKEGAFRGNDQYSQGVRDTLAAVDEFLERNGRANRVCDTDFGDELHEFLRSENERRFRAIPKDVSAKDLKLEFQPIEVVEKTPYKCSVVMRVILKSPKAHGG